MYMYLGVYLFIYHHKIQITDTKQDSRHKKANESGEEAQRETMRLIDIELPESKNSKVNCNSKASIESKIQ